MPNRIDEFSNAFLGWMDEYAQKQVGRCGVTPPLQGTQRSDGVSNGEDEAPKVSNGADALKASVESVSDSCGTDTEHLSSNGTDYPQGCHGSDTLGSHPDLAHSCTAAAGIQLADSKPAVSTAQMAQVGSAEESTLPAASASEFASQLAKAVNHEGGTGAVANRKPSDEGTNGGAAQSFSAPLIRSAVPPAIGAHSILDEYAPGAEALILAASCVLLSRALAYIGLAEMKCARTLAVEIRDHLDVVNMYALNKGIGMDLAEAQLALMAATVYPTDPEPTADDGVEFDA